MENVRRILLGYYATGTDYRNILTAIYAALDLRYPEGGKPLSFAVAGSRVLDMADWGDRTSGLHLLVCAAHGGLRAGDTS